MRIGGVLQGNQRVFRNVVRGFSLVLHDPEGSHYRIWGEYFAGCPEMNGKQI
jgi:hypothetical protein